MSGPRKRRPAAPESPANPAVDAQRLEGPGTAVPPHDFSYFVTPTNPAPPAKRPVPKPLRTAASGDKRHASRQRTRLRTGKVIDAAGHFISECLVFDRSNGGSRLRLPAGVTLKGRSVQFYDDERDLLQQADIMWRRDDEVGIRFRAAPATPQARILAEAMRQRFYAMPK